MTFCKCTRCLKFEISTIFFVFCVQNTLDYYYKNKTLFHVIGSDSYSSCLACFVNLPKFTCCHKVIYLACLFLVSLSLGSPFGVENTRSSSDRKDSMCVSIFNEEQNGGGGGTQDAKMLH